VELGSDGFMQDFGEQVQEGMRFHDGSTGVTMHNRYPVLFHRASRRILDGFARRTGRREPVWFFTRAGYSGRPGSAAYEMGNFPGDMTTDWVAGSGLRSQGPDMLNRAVGGAFGYTTDIGGYADFLSGATTEELFNRWSEWAALTPYFRVHNSATQGTRTPWSFGPDTLARWKRLAALHRRAVPYIRRLWRSGRRTGMPPTRPLWLAAPEAPGARSESQQWLLGRDVLVAPVVREGARSRSVSFPRGCWRRQGGDGRRFRGPRRAVVRAPLGVLPYFFRCGTRPF
jgi:alpha-glucosidase (family GH31 glycosyl hydrolase)